MDQGESRSCIDCGTKGCGGKGGRRPGFCLTDRLPEGMLEESVSHYGDGLEGRIMRVAATVEHDGYLSGAVCRRPWSSPSAWATAG